MLFSFFWIVWVSLEHWFIFYSSWKGMFAFLNVIPPFGEIVVNYPFNIGKTLNSIDLVNLMSSISVRFNSFLFSYSIFNERKDLILSDLIFFCHRGLKFQLIAVLPRLLAPSTAGWSVWMDSNHRPHAYQACALTTWATNRFFSLTWYLVPSIFPDLGPGTAGWWRWWGSNPWPPACRAGALPAELHPRFTGLFFFNDHSQPRSCFWSLKIEQQKFRTRFA